MKNCIFFVLIISMSSNIIGSEDKNIIVSYRKKLISNSDSALVIHNTDNKEKPKSFYSNHLSRKDEDNRIFNNKKEMIKNRTELFKNEHVKNCNNREFIKSAIKKNDHNALEMIKHCVNCHIIYEKLSK